MGDDELQRLTDERAAASDAIVNSAARKRLIVAGPGTGKSFTFRQALAKAIEDAGGGKGLALTFIRNLVADLEKDLGDLADVFTFHGYCKYLMHSHDVAGLAAGDYYPPLLELVVAGRAARRRPGVDDRRNQRAPPQSGHKRRRDPRRAHAR